MTWEQLVVPVFLILALLVQLMRRLKGTLEEEQGDEAEAAGIPESMERRVSIRDSRGPSEEKFAALPAMEEVSATRHRRAHVRVSHLPEARRGIVLMTILGPCRGLEPGSVGSELDKG